jgi:hypothetical protein
MRSLTALLALLVAALALSASARAQTTTTTTTTQSDTVTTARTAVPPAPPPPAPAVIQMTERTAFVVDRHQLKLGILAFEYGFAKRASIGSDPPAWLLRSVMSIWVPNVHLKYQFIDRDPIWVAGQAAIYYAFLDSNSHITSASLIDVPLSLFASFRLHPRFYLHGEADYVYARVFGTGNITNAELDGAGTARAVQTGLMAQLRVTHVFSLLATGRLQVYTGDVPFNGNAQIDPFTTANVSGQLTLNVRHPWELIGGAAFLWKHFQLIVGGGYGNYFAPGLLISNPKKTFVPDASIAVLL